MYDLKPDSRPILNWPKICFLLIEQSYVRVYLLFIHQQWDARYTSLKL